MINYLFIVNFIVGDIFYVGNEKFKALPYDLGFVVGVEFIYPIFYDKLCIDTFVTSGEKIIAKKYFIRSFEIKHMV